MKIKSKKLNNKGFTLIELLCSMMILSLLTVAMAVAISYGVKYYNETVLYSEAKTLSSTINTVISDELRYAKNIDPVNTDHNNYGLHSYVSALYGSGCRITAAFDDEDRAYQESDTAFASGSEKTHSGQLCIVNNSNNGLTSEALDVPGLYYHYLLGKGSYTHGLYITVKSFVFNQTNRTFTFCYDINNVKGDVVLGDIKLDVKVLGKN